MAGGWGRALPVPGTQGERESGSGRGEPGAPRRLRSERKLSRGEWEVDWLREEYPGGDDQEKIRKFLKEAYSLWGTDFVILGGDHELVPSRQTVEVNVYHPRGLDAPSEWYCAGLDSDWNDPFDAYYDWYDLAVDAYPELWVGRLPARDSIEAAAIVEKMMTYERVPGLGLEVPPDNFYTKALQAAGIAMYAGWDGTYDNPQTDDIRRWDKWSYQAELIKTTVLDAQDLAGLRMSSYLSESAGPWADCFVCGRSGHRR